MEAKTIPVDNVESFSLSEDGSLDLRCPDLATVKSLWSSRKTLAADLRHFPQIQSICIKLLDNPIYSFAKDDLPMSIPINSSTERLIDFVLNSSEPVEVTSMTTNRTLFLNDRYEPGRLIWKPAQLIGFNCHYYWQETPEELEQLLLTLRTDARLPNFQFHNLRLDGSLGRYVKDYFIVEDFLGDPVRVSIGREFQIICPAGELA